MRVHHLSCGTMCPPGGFLIDGRSKGLGSSVLVCHCLLIETKQGLVLVDTGIGLHDVQRPDDRLPARFRKFMRVQPRPEATAARQIEALGFSVHDVRHVVLTHLDFDHAGGLTDFPAATVHLMRKEANVAQDRRTRLERARFRPQQWGDRSRWRTYDVQGEPWMGFPAVRGLAELPPEILLVPLAGHTPGHAGVAIERDGHWMLHAGDAYFFRGEMDAKRPRCTPGLRAYQRLMEMDRRLRLTNQERLRQLVRERSREVRVFCAHDAVELDAFRNEQPSPPHVVGAGARAAAAVRVTN